VQTVGLKVRRVLYARNIGIVAAARARNGFVGDREFGRRLGVYRCYRSENVGAGNGIPGRICTPLEATPALRSPPLAYCQAEGQSLGRLADEYLATAPRRCLRGVVGAAMAALGLGQVCSGAPCFATKSSLSSDREAQMVILFCLKQIVPLRENHIANNLERSSMCSVSAPSCLMVTMSVMGPIAI